MNKKNENVVVRMAPSPTGNLHIGTVRTALFNFLFAKNQGGKYILRIEDTDKERSKQEFEDNILSGLEWLGLVHDEFYRQSERSGIYSGYVQKMIDEGTAYISKEEPKEVGQRSEVVRFKNPNKLIAFEDLIRDVVEVDTTDLGDFIIAKSPEEPLYHLAVVVDDHEMGVTHVIRGEDHISNTPRQILIQEAIGAKRPIYAHLPLIVDESRQKLSKRKHGAAVWLDTYITEGYLPSALVNYFSLLGWNPGTEEEIFSLKELIEIFDFSRTQKSAAFFDIKKLRWVNKEHLKRMPPEELSRIISEIILLRFPGVEVPPSVISLISERIEVLSDIDKLIQEGELDYYFEVPAIDPEKIPWKTSNKEEAKTHLTKLLDLIGDKKDVMKYAEEAGKGNVLWPLRYALSGKDKSPDPFTLLEILGPEESAKRIRQAINLL